MKKYFIIGLCISGIFISSSVHASPTIPDLSCEYDGKFKRCMLENTGGGNPRGIEDFICLQSQDQAKVLDQIILDEKFSEIDDRVEELLVNYREDKESAATDLLRNIDDITKMLAVDGVFYREFMELCNGGLLAERIACTDPIANTEAALRIRGGSENNSCKALVKTKLDIYKQVAIDIQKINKSEVHKDNRKKYVQKQRGKFSELLDVMFQGIAASVERLVNGLTHFTRNPL